MWRGVDVGETVGVTFTTHKTKTFAKTARRGWETNLEQSGVLLLRRVLQAANQN